MCCKNKINYFFCVFVCFLHILSFLGLINKVVAYFDYLWEKNRGQNESPLELIPQRVQTEVAVLIHSRMLQQNPVFHTAPETFVTMIAVGLQFSVALPNEYVFEQGEIATHIYIVGRGQVGIFTEKLGNISVQGSGSIFGEAPFLVQQSKKDNTVFEPLTQEIKVAFRFTTARGFAYCDLWLLNFEEFVEVKYAYVF